MWCLRQFWIMNVRMQILAKENLLDFAADTNSTKNGSFCVQTLKFAFWGFIHTHNAHLRYYQLYSPFSAKRKDLVSSKKKTHFPQV